MINIVLGESRVIINNWLFVFVYFCFFEDLMLISLNVVVIIVVIVVVVFLVEFCFVDFLCILIVKFNFGN